MTLSEQTRLDGRRALVCGASQGIGLAAAIELAAQGASVVLLARDPKKLAAATGQLHAGSGQRHEVVVADLQAVDTIGEILAPKVHEGPAVDIVINNSGGPAPGPVSEAELADFEAAFSQHVLAAQVIARLVIPGMRSNGYGRIINVISTSVKEPIAGLGVSNTIRGAMASWAKTLASELGRDGITVNNVLPGYTRTTRLQPIFEARARRAGMPLAEIEAAARASVPAGRFAEPAELGRAIAFLASPAAAYINGINLPVDGGRTGSL